MARRRVLRYGLLGLAAIVVIAVAAGAIVLARFNPNSLKPQIVAAVEQATGRNLALNGPIGLKVSLWPTVELSNVAFANPPGFSGATMATLERLDLELAVLPLLSHQIVIDRLVLVRPNISLETNAKGEPNWQFTPPADANAPGAKGAATSSGGAPASSSSAMPAGSTAQGPGTTISVRDVRIEDGTLAWRDDRTTKSVVLTLQRLTARAASPDDPMQLAVQAAYNGTPFKLDGEIGALDRLQQPDATTPWPAKLTLTIAGATLGVDGSLTHPLQGRGYKGTVNATIPDLTAIAPLLSGLPLPPLHDVSLVAQVADGGGPVPQIESATVHLGPADLGAFVSGLQITSVDIVAPPNNQPVQINAQASRDATPLSLVATVGSAGALLAGQPSAAVPVDVMVRAGNASLAVKGTIAHPETLSGADLALNAAIPDLGALAAVARRPLPAVTNIAFKGRLTDLSGGLQHGAALHDIALTSADGDLSGDLSVAAGPPRVIDGKLHANRVDADALLAAMGKPVAPPPGGAPGPASAAPPAPAAPPPHPTVSRRAGALFPDTPLPFSELRQANADLGVAVDDLKSGGLDYRAINLHVLLQDGKLRVDPLTADLPEGRLMASLTADATEAAPPVAVTVHAPGLAVTPLLAAAGLPGYASGKLEVYADLHGAGVSPHAIAAGLDGSVGLAIQGGTIDTALLNQFLGPILGKANLLGLLSGGGSGELRCFALRADMHHGVADLRTLLLNSSVLTMDGTGSANLADETLAMQLRPQGRVAGTSLVVPLQVTGPIRSPAVKVNAIGAAKADVGSVAGAVVGSATPLGLLGGMLGGGKLLNTTSADSCPGPLAIARGQAAPAAAATAASPAPQPKPKGAASVLQNLFR